MQHVRTQGINPHEILKSKNGALNPFSSLLRRFFIMSGPRNLELGIIVKARSLSLKSSHWLLSVLLFSTIRSNFLADDVFPTDSGEQ